LQPLEVGYQFGGPTIGGAASKAPPSKGNSGSAPAQLKRESSEKEWKAESKKNAFGGAELSPDSKDSKDAGNRQADRKPKRNQSKDEDVQVMKF
jgi:hypothetical protein